MMRINLISLRASVPLLAPLVRSFVRSFVELEEDINYTKNKSYMRDQNALNNRRFNTIDSFNSIFCQFSYSVALASKSIMNSMGGKK